MKQPILKKLLQPLYLFLIAGFFIALAISVIQILANEYIAYGTYNLAALNLWENINYFILVAVLCYAAFIIFEFLSKRVSEHFDSKNKPNRGQKINNILASFVFSVAVTLIFIFAIGYNTLGIVEFFKSNSIFDFLGNFSNSRKETIRIIEYGMLVFGVILFLLLSYISYRLGISQKLVQFFNRASQFKLAPYIAATAIVAFVLLNLYIYSFQNINAPKGPNVILISIDTLRADKLSSYGHERNTSPNIDEFAEKGILYEKAYSQAPWTLPAMATVHTSLYPTEHGAVYGNLAIKNNLLTLGEYMKNLNYRTLAVTTHPFVNVSHGFGQGFDEFRGRMHYGKHDISSQRITKNAIELLHENKDKKFFLWAHYFDPHGAYMDHDQYNYAKRPEYSNPKKLTLPKQNRLKEYKLDNTEIEYIRDVYDEEITYTDKYVGELINEVEKLGLMDDTIIILTADHGEELHERSRFGHGRFNYEELIHVPLIVFIPANEEMAGTRVSNNVEIRYIAKTIEDILGSDKGYFGGENLLEIANNVNNESNNTAFSEGSSASIGPSRHAVVIDHWKLVKNLKDDTYELYDLENDPGEKENLFYSEDPNVEERREELYSSLSNFKKSRKVELEKVKFTKEEIRELKALGYME